MRWMTAAIGALALALTGTSVQSSPAASGTIDVRSVTQAASSRHQVAYRRARIYGYRTAGPRNWSNPNAYRTGSARWWRVMDHNGRGGRPGV